MIPDYINCQNDEIVDCQYFYHKECPQTCALYNFLGIGGCADPGLRDRLEAQGE